MPQCRTCLILLAATAWIAVSPTCLQADVEVTRQEDVIYGRKDGMALTMDVFTPKQNANGLGLVWVISASWRSSHEAIRPQFAEEFLKRGYTVFAIVHGSQP